MGIRRYGLPWAVAIIGFVYATALAITPAPGISAQPAERTGGEQQDRQSATAVATPQPQKTANPDRFEDAGAFAGMFQQNPG